MKKRFFVILTVILIVFSSFTFTFSSSARALDDKIVINIYNNEDFVNTPIFTDFVYTEDIISTLNNQLPFASQMPLGRMYYENIVFDGIKFSITAQTEKYIIFDIRYDFMLVDYNEGVGCQIVHSGNTVYINDADKFDMFFNQYTGDINNVEFGNWSSMPCDSLSPDMNYNFSFGSSSGPIVEQFGNLVLSVIDVDGSSIISEVIDFEDVYSQFITGTAQYGHVYYGIYGLGTSSPMSELLIMDVDFYDVSFYSNIPDFYYNLTNAISYNHGNKIYYKEESPGYFVANINFEVNFYSSYSIELYVGGDEYESLDSIGMNLYNYNGRVVYGSKIIRGSYIDYSVYITKNDETVDFNLNIDGSSEYFTYTISYDLIEDIDYLGLSFTKNNPYPDIAIDKNFTADSITLYQGKFIPTGTFDNLNFYIVENGLYEVIKEEISKDFLDKSKGQASNLNNAVSGLSNQMNNFKNDGEKATNDVLDNVDMFFSGEGANNTTEVLNVIYELPQVTNFLLIVLSMALIGYVLFGKKS